jgi:hypothetical protein
MFLHCPKSRCDEGGYHIVNIVNNHIYKLYNIKSVVTYVTILNY